MTTTHLLMLMLALSVSLNVAFVAWAVARADGASMSRSVLVAAGAAATFLTVFFTALPSYQAAPPATGGLPDTSTAVPARPTPAGR